MTHPALVLKDRLNELAAELLQISTSDKGSRHTFERHLQSLRSAVRAYTRAEPTPSDWFAEQVEAVDILRWMLENHNAELRAHLRDDVKRRAR